MNVSQWELEFHNQLALLTEAFQQIVQHLKDGPRDMTGPEEPPWGRLLRAIREEVQQGTKAGFRSNMIALHPEDVKLLAAANPQPGLQLYRVDDLDVMPFTGVPKGQVWLMGGMR